MLTHDLTMGVIPCRWIQGFTDKSFFAFVNNETLCYTDGSHMCFLNVETKIQQVFESSVRGIGALTANSKSGIFAFSDHKLSPSIFVYNFKDFHLKNELKGMATLSSPCDFFWSSCGRIDYESLYLK